MAIEIKVSDFVTDAAMTVTQARALDAETRGDIAMMLAVLAESIAEGGDDVRPYMPREIEIDVDAFVACEA